MTAESLPPDLESRLLQVLWESKAEQAAQLESLCAQHPEHAWRVVQEVAAPIVDDLRSKGADLVVAIIHGGLDNSPYTPFLEHQAWYLAQALLATDVRLACHLIELATQAAPDDAAIRAVRRSIYALRAAGERSLMAKGVFTSAATTGT